VAIQQRDGWKYQHQAFLRERGIFMREFFVAILVLGLLGGCCNKKKCCTPTPPASSCVNFDAPAFVLGTKYGPGLTPGSLAFTANGIRATVWDFQFHTPGSGTFGSATIGLPSNGFGTGQTLKINNINMEFDFTALGSPIHTVALEYLDLGGFENLSVNGAPVPIYVGELSSAPTSIGGATVNVTTVSITPPASGKRGTVTIAATSPAKIDTLRIGGQEFAIDNVCAR
jgi:hypothetical protein